MTWVDIDDEIQRQGEIESLWRSLASYNVDDYPELRASLGERTINLGRQVGYTTYIVNNCRVGDVIVKVNGAQANSISSDLKALGKKCILLTVDNDKPLRGQNNLRPHTIWFDDYSEYKLTHKRASRDILTCLRLATAPQHYFRIMRFG